MEIPNFVPNQKKPTRAEQNVVYLLFDTEIEIY